MIRAAHLLAATLMLSGPGVRAQAWGTFYAAYLDGLAAQQHGDDARALAAFRSAAALKPVPGTRIRTYGLNFLREYHPYLHLAESALALGRLDQAEGALKAALDLGVEPRDRVALLRARLEAARAALTPASDRDLDGLPPRHRRRRPHWAD